MEHYWSIPSHGPVRTRLPTCSLDSSHLGELRFQLWLHQKVQGPGHKLGREPGKRTMAVGQWSLGLVVKRVGAAPHTHLTAWTWAQREVQGGSYSYWKAEPSRCFFGGS